MQNNNCKNNSHSHKLLSGIPTSFSNTQGGDPRQKHSGMTLKKQVILNLIQDLQRLPLSFLNNLRGRCQIKFGMTFLFSNRGFTLIELLVVVLIIGILAAVALPQYQKAVEKAHVAEGLTILNAMDKAQQVCVLEHGQKQCGGKNFWENAPFQPPTPLRLDEDECLDTAPCFRTKAWECFSEDLLYCMRIKNEKQIGTLSIGTAYVVPYPLTCSYSDENVDFCSDIGM